MATSDSVLWTFAPIWDAALRGRLTTDLLTARVRHEWTESGLVAAAQDEAAVDSLLSTICQELAYGIAKYPGPSHLASLLDPQQGRQCPACGGVSRDEAVFCASCGSQLDAEGGAPDEGLEDIRFFQCGQCAEETEALAGDESVLCGGCGELWVFYFCRSCGTANFVAVGARGYKRTPCVECGTRLRFDAAVVATLDDLPDVVVDDEIEGADEGEEFSA